MGSNLTPKTRSMIYGPNHQRPIAIATERLKRTLYLPKYGTLSVERCKHNEYIYVDCTYPLTKINLLAESERV
jgi:hypothetical protein